MTEWGPEIVVNGVRPEWPTDKDDREVVMRRAIGKDHFEACGMAGIDWEKTYSIQLWPHHSYYSTIKAPSPDVNYAYEARMAERRIDPDQPQPGYEKPPTIVGDYDDLEAVLTQALLQASDGKGKERHAQGQPFAQQPMQRMTDLYGQGFPLGQAAKKAQESMRLPYERARTELLGAIVYIAGAIVALDRGRENV